jgi:hypothetical protein
MRKRDIIIFAVVISGLVAVTVWVIISIIQQDVRIDGAGSLATGPYARIGRMRSRIAERQVPEFGTETPLGAFRRYHPCRARPQAPQN